MRRNAITRFHRRIKQNPEISDFYINTISSLLTLAALITTIYFSLSALNKTDIQNKNASEQLEEAKKQLILANEQFQYSKQLHDEESKIASEKEKIENERFTKDTIKQNARDQSQAQRNKTQDAINKGQLSALQLQAQTSKEQFKQQQLQYQQQQYEQRPIFTIDSTHIERTNAVRSYIEFSFSNIGIRSAHIDSTILAFYNPLELCFSVTSNSSNQDLVPLKTGINTSSINIYSACLNSPLTIYYLLIYYKDKTTGASQVEPIFFQYKINEQHRFTWSRVKQPFDEFIKRLKRKNVFVAE